MFHTHQRIFYYIHKALIANKRNSQNTNVHSHNFHSTVSISCSSLQIVGYLTDKSGSHVCRKWFRKNPENPLLPKKQKKVNILYRIKNTNQKIKSTNHTEDKNQTQNTKAFHLCTFIVAIYTYT